MMYVDFSYSFCEKEREGETRLVEANEDNVAEMFGKLTAKTEEVPRKSQTDSENPGNVQKRPQNHDQEKPPASKA